MVPGIDLTAASQAVYDQMVQWRRQIHSRPELGFEEKETARLIASALRDMGYEVKEQVGGYGLVATLPQRQGPMVGLRADMDALPVLEDTGLEYASQIPGRMHACGHDMHVAILLGVARILASGPEVGRPVLLFQSAEETPPGGAQAMVTAGALEGLEAILALHVHPFLPVGQIGLSMGRVTAASYDFVLEITGRGGHGALPHEANDAMVASAHAILGLQQIVSRLRNPMEPVVLTMGTIEGGYNDNVIAERVGIKGTVRVFSEDVGERVVNQMHQVLGGISQAYGVQVRLEVAKTYPCLSNDPGVAGVVREVAIGLLPQGVVEIIPGMGSEDFSYMAEQIPACYFFLGVAGEGEMIPWHNPRFNPEESAMAYGASLLAGSAFALMVK